MIPEDLLQLQSELRVQSVKHSQEIAKIRKQINSVLGYELTIAIEMSNSEDWDISPSRMLRILQEAKSKLSNIVSGESL